MGEPAKFPAADMLRAQRGDATGPINFMAAADGYVMVRRPGKMPWCEPLSDWVKRPLESAVAIDREKYAAMLSKAKSE